MFETAKAWTRRQWGQISTKIGGALALGSTLAGQLAPQITTLNSTWGDYATKIGAALGVALIIWNQDAPRGSSNAPAD